MSTWPFCAVTCYLPDVITEKTDMCLTYKILYACDLHLISEDVLVQRKMVQHEDGCGEKSIEGTF